MLERLMLQRKSANAAATPVPGGVGAYSGAAPLMDGQTALPNVRMMPTALGPPSMPPPGEALRPPSMPMAIGDDTPKTSRRQGGRTTDRKD